MKPTDYQGIYASESSMRIEFYYQGVRCRETIRGTPTKTHLQELARKRLQIHYEIDMGMFDYAAHFPNSVRAFEFSNNKAAMRTVAEAVGIWFQRNRKNWAHSTIRGYNSKITTYILPLWGKLKLNEFKAALLKDWMSTVQLSPKTINEVRALLLSIFQEQVQDEILDTNPISRTARMVRKKEEAQPFNTEEREKILAALPDNPARYFYQFAFWTGLRTGEQLGLTWQDVDFEKKRIYIRRSIVNGRDNGTKTESSSRTHHLHDEALSALQKVYKTHPRPEPEQRCFLDPRTMTPWKNDSFPRDRYWRPALKAAQVKYRRPYNCRHTYASTMLTNGADPTWLARQMGHKDWGMIRMIYARWIDD